MVVAIFRSLEGESLEGYSIRLAQAWRIGQKGLDNGVIFLVFLDDRKMRIEVGYGLEGTLTDAVSSSILRDVVAPRFRAGRTADGIAAGLDAIDRAIAGTSTPPPSPDQGGRSGGLGALYFHLGSERLQGAAARLCGRAVPTSSVSGFSVRPRAGGQARPGSARRA